MRKLITSCVFVFCLITHPCAQIFHEFKIVNDNIIELHFEDGQLWSERISSEVLDNVENYLIASLDDARYLEVRNPDEVGRKSKTWRPQSSSNLNLDHWVYLQLPDTLLRGMEYTVSFSAHGVSPSEITFVYDEKLMPSESIHLNHIGFVPGANMKYAYLYHWMGTLGAVDMQAYEARKFYLYDISDTTKADSGIVEFRKELDSTEISDLANETNKGFYGSDVWECNFSDFNTPGEYIIVVEGIGASVPFRISEDIYHDVFVHTARGLYHQRSGPAREMPWSKWNKPADHIPGLNGYKVVYSNWKYSQGNNAFTQLPDNATTWSCPDNVQSWMTQEDTLWGWGGYFDAGDYDRNIKHMIIANQLLWVYEMAPNMFYDNQLNIPESGNGIPDIIDEARWVIDFFDRMRGPTGGICGGLETTGHLSGPSWNENHVWYAYAEEPYPSYWFAASAAQLAYCLELAGDVTEKTELIDDAKSVFQWARDHDLNNSWESYRMMAAAWLYKVTGEQQYLDDYKDHTNVTLPNSNPTQEQSVWAYITTNHPEMDYELKEIQTQAAIHWANITGGDQAPDRTCRQIMDDDDGLWLGQTASTPQVFDQIMAHYITRDNKYLDYLYTTCDYTLGGNPLNLSWITGIEELGAERGAKSVLATDSKYDSVESVIPGIVVYGIAINVNWTSTNANQQATIYPSSVRSWPAHEIYFDNRFCVETNEYTVHQTMGPSAAAYAYMSIWGNNDTVTVSSLKLELDTMELGNGFFKSLNYSILPFNAGITDVIWLSNDESVATVSAEGIVSGHQIGETYIYAQSVQNPAVRDSVLISVFEPIRVTNIEIEQDTLRFFPNQSDYLVITILPEDATLKTYTISGDVEQIVHYDEFGFLRAKNPGEGYIYCMSDDGDFRDSCYIIVSPQVLPGRLEAEYFSDHFGILTGAASDVDGGNYAGWFAVNEWMKFVTEVETEGYYTVSSRVAGQGSGKYSLYSNTDSLENVPVSATGGWLTWKTFEDGVIHLPAGISEMLFNIDVAGFNLNWLQFDYLPDFVPTESVNIIADTIYLYEDQSIQLEYEIQPNNATISEVNWKSLSTATCTIDNSGLVLGKNNGETKIIGTSGFRLITDAVVVVVSKFTGTYDNVFNRNVFVYPNPVAENQPIYLKFNDIHSVVQIILSDLSGKSITYEQCVVNGSKMWRFDERLEKGIYIMTIVIEGKRINKKLIVQ